MKKLLIRVLYCVIVLAVGILAYKQGRDDVWVAEFKIYNGNLVGIDSDNIQYSDDLKEFLKGRYYYLANKIPNGWLGSPFDYGAVGSKIKHLAVGKGPTSAQYEYQLFKEKKVLFREPGKSGTP